MKLSATSTITFLKFKLRFKEYSIFIGFDRLIFIVLFLLVTSKKADAQNQVVQDSLLLVLKKAISDSAKVEALNSLAWELKANNIDTALDLSTQAKILSEKINWPFGIAQAENQISTYYSMMGQYDLSFEIANKVVGRCNLMLEKLPDVTNPVLKKVKKLKGYALNNCGTYYLYQGNYPNALAMYLESLKLYEQVDDKKGMAGAYGNIGGVYMSIEKYDKALYYFESAFDIAKLLGDKNRMATQLVNSGIIYSNLNQFDKALKSGFDALKLFEEIGNEYNIAKTCSNIGWYYKGSGLYTEGIKYLELALQKQSNFGVDNVTIASHLGLGIIYTKTNRYDNAEYQLKQALKLADSLDLWHQKMECENNLSELYVKTGRFEKALDYYKRSEITEDSIFNEDKAAEISQMQATFEFEKKEVATKAEQEKKDAITLKEKQRQKLIRDGFIGGFATVLVFAGVFFTQRNKIKKGKLRSDELLLNILPIEVAEELKQNGSAVAKQFNEVTVMFTDFKNFTQIAERLSPVELVAEIHTCFKAFDGIMEKYGIEKIKTMGDSYMAAGGLPVPKTTNAVDVVNAALEIQGYMQNHIQQKMKEGKAVFEIRIGIHTGPVVAGIVGVKKFSYDIWGDTVNLASRMESSGEEGKVNISGSTYELVKDVFACTYRGKIEARNKGEVDMYFVEFKSIS